MFQTHYSYPACCLSKHHQRSATRLLLLLNPNSMSQSPLARSTRRSLPAFAQPPSKLSRSNVASEDPNSPSPSPLSFGSTRTPLKKFATPSRESTTRYRNVGSSTNTPAATPIIHYSPYALSTPPQSLSKSASIPFDMAASAKAARRAEEDVKLRGTESNSKKKLIRKKPLYQRVIGFPQKIADKFLYHTPASILDILPDPHLANPIALGIHVVHYLLVAPLFAAKSDDFESVLRTSRTRNDVSSRWDEWENEGKSGKSCLLGGGVRAVLVLLLMAMAVGNALYLFTRFRTYDMLLRNAQEPVLSPHASPAPAPKVKAAKDNDEKVFGAASPVKAEPWTPKVLKFTGRSLVFISKLLIHSLFSAFGRPQANAPSLKDLGQAENKIQSLRVWDPPEFCLAFFCAYPPTAPFLTHLFTHINPFLTPVLHLSTTFLLSNLAQSYAQLVKDRMLLSAEVMREYDQRFVYKKIFSNKVDRGVSTNESEFIGF
ncbi:hypothetical protein J010_04737 [Cryptococcus neoformans]|uniref:Uncharacterized protein n=1 Tax=Cryptococcus neoformans Tu259-1 TaxID=1230072 RepID=A0A854Q727_CRYNE|nr:hypothetical protein C361_05151 [Cryptococcus neoformans var. grubii Tu259-1]OXG47548.1 hypothetical protein C355_04862 [Cryptococcus neoformans var. grubii Th84]OXG81840.1 hypothetical protein C346_04775 [Cryptococcus neoformans var. grubii D17-1]OXG94404.1 hypothetical protein C345_04662 [Cryptococcus neoformans var. grubii A2-102-5]OXH05900.1 hypothetical protein J010_04737 [Cryptococcus neoformans var. grubii]